ncbi:MAG: nucleotidyltransferase substrate binding protein [Oligoflexia bacterium]|jgi:nucleotidyltransferase substrate binding protein (TIGR01987 family)
MPSPDLRLDELKKALARLKEALALKKDDIVRDSTIQRFEFTVELSWKVLQRALKGAGVPDPQSPKALFREGARLGWVADPEAWIQFVDDRNLSSHTYKEDLAEKVYASASRLPPHVEALIRAIEKQN